jgi:hypothetical protein
MAVRTREANMNDSSAATVVGDQALPRETGARSTGIAGRSAALGIEYQHRYFWLQALRLFVERATVSHVALERKIVRAFDDVVTDYAAPQKDDFGRPITSDRFQLKFHVDYRQDIRAADLEEPAFIGAKRWALLDHLRHATRNGPIPSRLTFISSYALAEGDPLRYLVSGKNGEINYEKLFAGDADRAMREVRDRWLARLGVDDAGLVEALKHLRIRANVPQWALDDELDLRLRLLGLEPLDGASLIDRYLGLSDAFIRTRSHIHDASSLERILRDERLWGERPSPPDDGGPLAIKSFTRAVVRLEDEAATLDLVPFFAGRFTASAVDWDRDVAVEVRTFLDSKIADGGRYAVHFDCHLSIAYLAGYKLGRTTADLTPIQRTPGVRAPWRRMVTSVPQPVWTSDEVRTGDGPDIAIAISVARQVRAHVEDYVRRALPSVGRVRALTIANGVGETAVRDGDHAHVLADDFARVVDEIRAEPAGGAIVHLFMAVPVTLAYLLGRQGRALGRTVLYEYDFDTRDLGAYAPSFHLPPSR